MWLYIRDFPVIYSTGYFITTVGGDKTSDNHLFKRLIKKHWFIKEWNKWVFKKIIQLIPSNTPIN